MYDGGPGEADQNNRSLVSHRALDSLGQLSECEGPFWKAAQPGFAMCWIQSLEHAGSTAETLKPCINLLHSFKAWGWLSEG